MIGISSIGCVKSRLIGEYKIQGKEIGSFSYLYHKGKVIGVLLRTKTKVRHLFVSPGHLIDISSSIEIVLKSTKQYRIPEPLKKYHQMATA